MIAVTLTSEELAMASTIASQRHIESILSGRKDRHGAANSDNHLGHHFEGACGELALCKRDDRTRPSGRAGQGRARQGRAWLGRARQARPGGAGHGRAWRGRARRGLARLGKAGTVRQGLHPMSNPKAISA